MINRERLSSVKEGAVLINLARGGLVESLDVVYEGLESGRLSGAGLDVSGSTSRHSASHPPPPRLVCSPHTIGLSRKAAEAIFIMMSQESPTFSTAGRRRTS